MGDELKKLSKELLRLQDEIDLKIDEDQARALLGTVPGGAPTTATTPVPTQNTDLIKLSDKFTTQIKNLEKRLNKL
jgi:hypothetical protein